jgi:hypothetical protein
MCRVAADCDPLVQGTRGAAWHNTLRNTSGHVECGLHLCRARAQGGSRVVRCSFQPEHVVLFVQGLFDKMCTVHLEGPSMLPTVAAEC